MADVTISIKSGIISVDKNKVKVKAKSETVTWMCHDGTFSIIFNTKSSSPGPLPVNPATTQTGKVWKAEAGPFDTASAIYSYGIEALGAKPLDPEIEIIP